MAKVISSIGNSVISRTSQLFNDGENSTSEYVESIELGTVAFSNDYNDLDNIPPESEGITNLSYIASPTNGVVNSDTGTDATIPLGTTINAGLLSPADKTKLDNTSGVNSGDQDLQSVLDNGNIATSDIQLLEGAGIYIYKIGNNTNEVGALLDGNNGGELRLFNAINPVLIPNVIYPNTEQTLSGDFMLPLGTGLTQTLATLDDIPSPIDITGLVPYTGATTNVDLGEFQIKTGQLEFDQIPTGTFSTGKIRWNDSDGTAEIMLKGGNVTLQIGQEQLLRVVNKTGIDLLESQYKVVYISGAQGNRLKVDLALSNNTVNSNKTIGIVTENINNNNEGFITTSGLVRNINTTGSLQSETWTDGDILYVSSTILGGLTNVMPISPNHKVLAGYVVKAHITQGSIFAKVDTGLSLGEIHDVKIVGTTAGKFLGSTTEGVWENKTVDSILGYIPENLLNKQNSLTVDGTGVKYATVDAVNTLKWIKSNETLYLAQRKGDVLYGILDQYTGEEITLSKVTGTPTVDGIIYFQLGSEYFIRNGDVTVLNFGADPTGMNDSSLAFQKAIDILPEGVLQEEPELQGQSPLGGGGRVMVPDGKYKISNSVLIPSHVEIFGSSAGGVTIFSYVNNDALFKRKDRVGVYATMGIKLTNLFIEGTNSTNGSAADFARADYGVVTNLKIWNFDVDGFILSKCQYWKFYNCEIQGCAGVGIHMKTADTYPCSNNHIYGNKFSTNGIGVVINGGTNGIHGGTTQNNTIAGIKVGGGVVGQDDAFMNVIDNVHFEYHFDSYDLICEVNSFNTLVTGCFFVVPAVAKTKAFIYNRGITNVTYCSTQTQNITPINGSVSPIEQHVLDGYINVIGGSWGNFLNEKQVVKPNVVNGDLRFRARVTLSNGNSPNLKQTGGTDYYSPDTGVGISGTYSADQHPRWKLNGSSLYFGQGSNSPSEVLGNYGSEWRMFDDNYRFIEVGGNNSTITYRWTGFSDIYGANRIVNGMDGTGEMYYLFQVSNSSTKGNESWDDVFKINANGTIEGSDGTNANHFVTKSQLDLKANLDSPTLTGIPTAPTATVGTNTTQLATTAFVQAANGTFVADAITNGVTTIAPSQNAVFDGLALKANLGGATFNGQVETFNASFLTNQDYKLNSLGSGLTTTVGSGYSFTTGGGTGWVSSAPITATRFDGGIVRLKSYTVATLPTGVQGDTAFVTDATAPTYLGILIGGGSIVAPVFYNGTTWVSH